MLSFVYLYCNQKTNIMNAQVGITYLIKSLLKKDIHTVVKVINVLSNLDVEVEVDDTYAPYDKQIEDLLSANLLKKYSHGNRFKIRKTALIER